MPKSGRLSRASLVLALAIVGAFPAGAQSPTPGGGKGPGSPETDLSLRVGLGLGIPLMDSAELFALGPTGRVSVEWNSPGGMPFYVIGDLGYGYSPLLATTSVSILRAGAGIGYGLPIVPWLYARAYLLGGYYYGLLNDPGRAACGGNPFATGGVELSVNVTSLLSFELGASYQELFGFHHGLDVALGSSFHLGTGTKAPIIKPVKPTPLQHQKAEAIDFKTVGFDTVFPVFYSHYDDHPIGRLSIGNKKTAPVKDVRVSVYIKQYMDSPKNCATIAELAPGETRSVDLFALFTDKVLAITEGTKVAVDVMVNYTYEGNPEQDTRTETMSMYDRNAMTWSDNRRAAAFMTMKDPQVLTFSKNVVAMLRDREGRFISDTLLRGMGLHEALTAHGISYVIDPTSPFSGAMKGRDETDFLQFPIQTLEYKAGDCDDLTILNCALFESIGISTAFITVPGHIFMAFKLDMSEEDARRTFIRPDELIFRDGGVWVPLEITEISGGFLKAWETGAKEWRENAARKTAELFPTLEAWQRYAAVGLPATGYAVSVPPADAVMAGIDRETDRFISREVDPRVAVLQSGMKKSGEDSKSLNQIGILYGRFGLLDKAEAFFLRAIKKKEYTPSLINLGNLSYKGKNMAKAFSYFERALKAAPENPKALQGYILAGYELQKYDKVNDAYETLKTLSPESATKVAFIESPQGTSARAGEAGKPAQGVDLWTE